MLELSYFMPSQAAEHDRPPNTDISSRPSDNKEIDYWPGNSSFIISDNSLIIKKFKPV
jgi:hypothetical protein